MKGVITLSRKNFNYGIPYTKELEAQIVKDNHVPGLNAPVGGEPFLNTACAFSLVKLFLRQAYTRSTLRTCGRGLDYTWEGVMQETKRIAQLLGLIMDGETKRRV